MGVMYCGHFNFFVMEKHLNKHIQLTSNESVSFLK